MHLESTKQSAFLGQISMNGLYNFILSGLNVQLNSRATFKELGIVNIPLMYHKCTIDRFYIVQLVMAKYNDNDNVNVGIISALNSKQERHLGSSQDTKIHAPVNLCYVLHFHVKLTSSEVNVNRVQVSRHVM